MDYVYADNWIGKLELLNWYNLLCVISIHSNVKHYSFGRYHSVLNYLRIYLSLFFSTVIDIYCRKIWILLCGVNGNFHPEFSPGLHSGGD